VGAEVLDGTQAGGATSFCGSRRCELGGWNAESCQHLLKALQQKSQRLAQSRELRVSLPVAFSTLTANDYFRGELLGSLVRDVLDALKLSKFDIKSANLVEDPHRTVSVTPYAVLPSSLFEIVFYMAQERDVDAVESNLRELFSVPFSWKQGWDVVKRFCLNGPCPQCQTTCVESSQTSLVSLGLPIFA